MATAQHATTTTLTAQEFLATDQRCFGSAWRYELVDGIIIAHAAPSPDHGALLFSLSAALQNRLRGRQDRCRGEVGSGAAPVNEKRSTARIPDAMIRCGEHPRVLFEIVSPSELRHLRERNRKRRDEQQVEGVQEIVEIYQNEPALHIYRREPDGKWSFESVDGLDSVLALQSVGIEIPLSELYDNVEVTPDGERSGD